MSNQVGKYWKWKLMAYIDYSLDKIKEIYNKTFPEYDKRPLTITGKDIGEGAWNIAVYADFFFLEMTAFFDILARHLTKNQNIKNIYFQNWVKWQYSRCKNDDLVLYLKRQLDWYIEFKKVRNKLGHESHIWHEIDSIMIIDKGIKILTMYVGDNKIELVDYCKDIRKKLADITDFMETNNYWNKRYTYL